jgi:ornithine cyclodeaminase/alanine dehydrogenase-like protein (mu-crystallin family)
MALLLREDDVKRLLTMDAALRVVEAAFASLANGTAVNVPRQRGVLPGATINVLPSVSRELDATGVKAYPVIRQDVTVGSSFTLLIYRISSGGLEGIIEASALGQIRTGAASGVAAKYMARPDSRILTIFGSGFQAEAQIEALRRVLPRLERIQVIGRSAERAREFALAMRTALDLDVVHSTDVRSAVAQADVITTATGATDPLFDGSWVKPGAHINAIGSNYADKRELDAIAVQRANRIVADEVATAMNECGDLIGAARQFQFDWSTVRPLSDIVGGLAPGRVREDEITLFESQGIGLEDLAVGCHVLSVARESGCGLDVPIH